MTESTKRKTSAQVSIVSFNNGTYSVTLVEPGRTLKLTDCSWGAVQKVIQDIAPKTDKANGHPQAAISTLGSLGGMLSSSMLPRHDGALPFSIGKTDGTPVILKGFWIKE